MRALRDFLLAPAAPAAPVPRATAVRSRPAPSAPPPVLGLVAERAHCRALAISLALVAARAHRLGCAIAAIHDAAAVEPGAPRVRASAAPAARRLAASLQARDVAAGAAGRVVEVALPPDPSAVTLAAERTAAAAVAAATVIAAAGPRDAALDVLLARCDLVLVAVPASRAALAELASQGLRELGATTATVVVPVRPATRWAAGLGWFPAARAAGALRPAVALAREPS